MNNNALKRDELKKARGKVIMHGGNECIIVDATKNAMVILQYANMNNGSMGDTRMIPFSSLTFPLQFV